MMEAAAIVLATLCLALIVNAVRPDGIPVLRWKPPSVSQGVTVSAARAIPLEEAFDKYRTGKALFLDARSEEAYAKGHIRGALSLPDQSFDERFDEVARQLEECEVIVAYCDGAECPLGRSLAEKLIALGFHNAHYLENGWSRWREAGHPVAEGP